MTTIAPGGALQEGPVRPRVLLPGSGPSSPALLPGLGFLRPVLRPVLGPVVRPVRPVLSPVLRAALPAHLRSRPFLPPAPRRPVGESLPPVEVSRRRLRVLLAVAPGTAAVAGLAVLAVVAWPPGAARSAVGPARVPVAAVPVAGGLRLVDATGADLGVAATAPAGVPRVVAGDDPGMVASRVDGAAVTAAVAVRAELPPALAPEVAVVGATSRDGVWLALHYGARVLWGSPERAEDKAAALAALRAAVPHAARYDVSAPDAPALTRR